MLMSSSAVNFTRAIALSLMGLRSDDRLNDVIVDLNALRGQPRTRPEPGLPDRMTRITRLTDRAAMCIMERTPALLVTINDEKSTWKDAFPGLTRVCSNTARTACAARSLALVCQIRWPQAVPHLVESPAIIAVAALPSGKSCLQLGAHPLGREARPAPARRTTSRSAIRFTMANRSTFTRRRPKVQVSGATWYTIANGVPISAASSVDVPLATAATRA